MRSTKAQGLSINTIILIVLGLIVLIISVLVFNKYYKNVNTTTQNSCTNMGGECGTLVSENCKANGVIAAYCDGGQVCCAKTK